jgi:chromosome partitioning protein
VLTTVAITNSKGGVGKTTIAFNLAHALVSFHNQKVLLVDADPHTSATAWASQRNGNRLPFNLIQGAHETLHRSLPAVAQEGRYDFVLVDCPAGVEKITRSALLVSDAVIVPVPPAALDFLGSASVVELLRDVVAVKPELRVMLAISRKPPRNRLRSKDARDSVLEFFAVDGASVLLLKTEINENEYLTRAPGEGKSIFEFKPRSNAAQEFNSLTEEVVECLRPREMAAG